MVIREHWRGGRLDRQIMAALFECTQSGNSRSGAATHTSPSGNYIQESVRPRFPPASGGLSRIRSRHRLVRDLGSFITELGRDFCVIGSENPVKVGGRDLEVEARPSLIGRCSRLEAHNLDLAQCRRFRIPLEPPRHASKVGRAVDESQVVSAINRVEKCLEP